MPGDKEMQAAEELLARAYALQDDVQARALYRDWAATYDETMLDGLGYQTPAKTADLLVAFLTDRDAAILDIGSGTGLAGAELAAKGFTAIDALDYSPEMLAVARARGVYRRLIEADLNAALDLPDATWDAMICTGTFTHAHVGGKCLGELFRLLRPDGLFACTVHGDVWESGGFAAEVSRLATAGILETLHHEPGAYYASSRVPEGFYILWRKSAG